MELTLNKIEERVVGALIEKSLTTPDYYPMTLNALTAACNQKSNRDPVLALDETTVARTLDGLRERQLVRELSGADMRVHKYYHRFPEVYVFTESEVALLAELMLRGPQTVGELRGRASRMHEFADLRHVEAILEVLANRENGAAVVKLERLAGHKESRFAHLLAGEPDLPLVVDSEGPREAARVHIVTENERIDKLEQQLSVVQSQMDEIRQQFERFRE